MAIKINEKQLKTGFMLLLEKRKVEKMYQYKFDDNLCLKVEEILEEGIKEHLKIEDENKTKIEEQE